MDERDTMFARAARRPGTPAYRDYYRRRPELEETDGRLRALPPLLAPGGRFFDRRLCAEAEGFFAAIASIRPDPELAAARGRALAAASDPAGEVVRLARSLGAVAAGGAPVGPAAVYTHKGRFDADYGRPVEPPDPFALVFLVEMDFDAMQRAPGAETIRESARQYLRAAEIARALEAALRAGGWRAKAHYDAHYDVILPPLAVAAGLGEMGRNNILVADARGARVRIGAVTTDLAIPAASARPLRVAQFCRVCLKCSRSCPSQALSSGPPETARGVALWPTAVERCYRYWRLVGTDCGVCMAVCPFSHRDSRFHAAIRWMVRRFPSLHRPLAKADDIVYGRRWKPLRRPPSGSAAVCAPGVAGDGDRTAKKEAQR